MVSAMDGYTDKERKMGQGVELGMVIIIGEGRKVGRNHAEAIKILWWVKSPQW